MREEEVDDDRLDFLPDQLASGLLHLVFVQGNDLVPEHVDPLGDAAHVAARKQTLRVLVGDRVQAVRVRVADPSLDAAAHEHVVLDACRCDQAELRAPPA
jgi:hypothetical protein